MRSRKEVVETSWRASPSPEHAESSRGSRVASKIVQEETDAWGRKKYEVQWLTSKGSEPTADTTWEYLHSDDDFELIEDWEERITRKRRRLAHSSYEVPIPDNHVPLHGYPTFENAHALEQKQKRSSRHPLSRYQDWDALESDPYGPSSSSPSRSQVHYSQPNDAPLSPGTTVVELEIPESPVIEKVVRKASDGSDPRPRKKQKTSDPKETLWTRLCKQAGAASISIVNEFNEELSPPVPEGFRYVEGDYALSKGIPDPDPGFLVACDCTAGCRDVEVCECQDAAGEDYHGQKAYAYDSQGYYKFDRPGVIVECNQNCACTVSCQNRVAQRPRDVPIQVFRTESRGWGVRATVDLPRGKFIGLYTGRLISRAKADKVTGEHKSYIFDLDAIDTAEEDLDDAEEYSVDAYHQGNWSRFINHSCEPNMEVHSVVWNTPPSMNRPYLAFFANRRIPAFTELTIDYDPSAARDEKGKKVVIGKDEKRCMCGAESCRGYLAV